MTEQLEKEKSEDARSTTPAPVKNSCLLPAVGLLWRKWAPLSGKQSAKHFEIRPQDHVCDPETAHLEIFHKRILKAGTSTVCLSALRKRAATST